MRKFLITYVETEKKVTNLGIRNFKKIIGMFFFLKILE